MASFREAIAGTDEVPLLAEEPDSAEVPASPAGHFPDRLPTLREAEDHLITEALHRAEGNQGVAAGLLGLSRQALNKRLSRRRESHGPADAAETADA